MTKKVIPGNSFLLKTLAAISSFVRDAVSSEMESIRIARATCSLLFTGVSARTPIFMTGAELLIRRQKPDGGWSDPEETAWVAAVLRLVRGDDDLSLDAARQWLASARHSTGGWGRHARDQVRIPTTALVIALTPSVARSEDSAWLTTEWQRDFEGPVRLSYKAGFFLLAMAQGHENDLVVRTISHLAQDQNDDGGFGPWHDHPIGSDPWSTGVVLWGLSKWIDHVDSVVIEKALDWLRKTQLPSGYWPYHYLDDGTSLALIGAVSAMKALATKE
ncbi:MAG: terpene cyclase/mutase family protein [Deltaproteobacteria bacterium]|nr:terpene cyclase/mutase family protein [Deltaproteobacteria bacterium]MBL7177889.1 terpene cyclase/mutase family protein [Desulfobacteraceae bacterium]